METGISKSKAQNVTTKVPNRIGMVSKLHGFDSQ